MPARAGFGFGDGQQVLGDCGGNCCGRPCSSYGRASNLPDWGLPAGRPFDPDSNYTSKYLDVANTPQYPFGYGLSCTTFALSNLHLSASSVSTAGTLTVTADLTSTGSRTGDDVAQLRIHESGTSILQPVRRLDGFQRVTLTPGQTQTVTFTLGPANLGFYNNQDSSPSNTAASTCTSATVHRPACTTSSPCADRSASVQ